MVASGDPLRLEDVQSLDAAAEAIAERLERRALAATLVALGARAQRDRPAFVRNLQAFALLVDQALFAIDYRHDVLAWGAEPRSGERTPGPASGGATARQARSRTQLAAALDEVASSPDPEDSLGRALVELLIREIGVEPWTARGWYATPDCALAALAADTLLPLRALNERAAAWARHRLAIDSWETEAVVKDITRSVIEGRFAAWRATNPASRQQLAALSEAQRDAWFSASAPRRFETEDLDGTPLAVSTFAPTGLALFWATKVGHPKHGFDAMTHHALPLLTSARTAVLLAQDGRAASPVARADLRLLVLASDGNPVLHLDRPERSFPAAPLPAGEEPSWPSEQLGASSTPQVEAALIAHALDHASRLDVPLALAAELGDAARELGLGGEWREERYRLAPSLLIEAGAAFGRDAWRQQVEEVLPLATPQLFVLAQPVP